MPAPKDVDFYENPFGHALRRQRERLGMTQAQFAERLGYSADLISKVETGAAGPSEDFAHDCDTFFEMHGMMAYLALLARRVVGFPRWFRRWAEEIEPHARILRTWEPLLVPGLLQTAEYARAVLRCRPGVTEEQVEEQVAARLERQKILDRDDPPLLWVVVDEGVLHRLFGSPKVMHDQLQALVEASYHTHVTIQVLPLEAQVPGFLGAFAIASAREGPDTVYLESAGEGLVTDHSATVEAISISFEAIRSKALPVDASVELITKVMETRWKAQT